MQVFFHDEFLGDSVRFLLKDICDQNIEFCFNIMSLIWGDDREQFNNVSNNNLLLKYNSNRIFEHRIP